MLTRFAISLLALAAGSFAHDAMAADVKRIPGLKPEPDSVLGDLRGGFVTAGGLTFDIGITTSTYINGQLALRTSIATGPTAPTAPTGPTSPTAPTAPGGSPSGGAAGPSTSPSGHAPPSVTVQTGGPTGAPLTTAVLTPPANPSPPGALNPAPLNPAPQTLAVQNPAPQTQAPQSSGPQNTAPQMQASLAPTGGGGSAPTVTASTPDGETTVTQNPGQLLNVVKNAANDQSIRLDTQVNVVLPGFDAVQRNQVLSAMGMKMGADGSFGIVSSLPH